ncbi:hypothetical protein E1B28_007791 [Marasmius oreades]|uniref:Uncharacterized protein n=1 Tax=Marasmius oreades TaxID=181124 RepID=A0A9P7S2F8_9AGAR|nr:uncharacterized protein E1B28_007791 [Marasmius oreades]KAG7094184.1 hypothetical protein E1B28_007791 [Marasmius oreades]
MDTASRGAAKYGSAATYAAYWAQYGYDVNSSQFKEWAVTQPYQYSQYYAQAGYNGVAPEGMHNLNRRNKLRLLHRRRLVRELTVKLVR